jgi:hypothetical protein
MRAVPAALAALAACSLVACEHPPLSLRFKLTDGTAQQCFSDTGVQTTSCQDITMLCEAYLSVRVLAPSDPIAPYISVCERIDDRAQGKLCAIANVTLPQPAMPVPEQVLEVQMAIFPRSAITFDASGTPICPIARFGANGLPIPFQPFCQDDPERCTPVPAVGGRTYYRPGDDKTVVELGCTDLGQLTDEVACTGTRRVSVTATVNDFDDLVSSVGRTLADRLDVGVGEPRPFGDDHVLTPGDTRELMRWQNTPPAWRAELDVMFTSNVCIGVLEDGAQRTTAVTCRGYDGRTMIDLAGVYLAKTTLDQVLAALSLTSFPEDGLVIGMVIDEFFNPLANVAVSCAGCTVEYLNSNRTALQPNATSASGIFISRDAPFGTGFTIPATVLRPVLGGLIREKVTIVVVQDKNPIGP